MKLKILLIAALAVIFTGPAAVVAQDGDLPDQTTLKQRHAAQGALMRLAGDDLSGLSLTWPRARTAPSRVAGFKWAGTGTEADALAVEFVAAFPELTLAMVDELKIVNTQRANGRAAVRFRQMYEGLEVLERTLVVTVDEGSRRVLAMSANTASVGIVDMTTDIGSEAAAQAAQIAVLGNEGKSARKVPDALVRRAIWASPGGAAVVYRVVVPTVPMLEKIVCLVDAATGKVIKTTNEVVK